MFFMWRQENKQYIKKEKKLGHDVDVYWWFESGKGCEWFFCDERLLEVVEINESRCFLKYVN